MSIFKNRLTGDIVTAFGAVADHFAARLDHEQIHEDRGGEQDTTPQPAVLDDEPSQDPEDPADAESTDSQDNATADDASDNSRSTK